MVTEREQEANGKGGGVDLKRKRKKKDLKDVFFFSSFIIRSDLEGVGLRSKQSSSNHREMGLTLCLSPSN